MIPIGPMTPPLPWWRETAKVNKRIQRHFFSIIFNPDLFTIVPCGPFGPRMPFGPKSPGGPWNQQSCIFMHTICTTIILDVTVFQNQLWLYLHLYLHLVMERLTSVNSFHTQCNVSSCLNVSALGPEQWFQCNRTFFFWNVFMVHNGKFDLHWSHKHTYSKEQLSQAIGRNWLMNDERTWWIHTYGNTHAVTASDRFGLDMAKCCNVWVISESQNKPCLLKCTRN